MRLTFSRAMPAMAARSLCVTFWRIRMRPAADIVAEGLGEAEQRLRDAALERQEAHRGDDVVGVAQAPHQQLDDMAVDVRMVCGDRARTRRG